MLPKDAPQTGAYQKLIAEIAEQKSITEQQVADMTWATVKKAREMGVDCDCLSLLLGAHKVCMADNALSAQKGADAYASILAGIVVLMKADTDAPTPKGKDSATTAKELIIPEGTPLYTDEETLRTMKSESEKQGEAGTEALKRLSKEGKIWSAEGNIVVRVLRQGGPMGAIQVEAKDGNRLKTSRFWVIGDKFPTANSARARQMQKNTRRASEFVQIFDGRNAMFLNGADIGNLAEMVQAIYDGKVSAKTASQYAFKRDALEGKFTNVAGQYLIYEVEISRRRHLEFAMRRDADFEKEKAKTYGSVQDFYDDLRGAEFHSDSPLTQAGAMIVGMEQFTTSVGLVKVVPIVESVNIAP